METTRGMSARPADKQREFEIVQLPFDIRKCLKRGAPFCFHVRTGQDAGNAGASDKACRKKALPPTPVFCSGLGMIW